MNWTIYVLYSEKDAKLYIGCTSNLEQRLKRHETGLVPSTRNRRPLVLIHKERFDNKGDAFARERFLKSLWGARFKKKILLQYLDREKTYPNENDHTAM